MADTETNIRQFRFTFDTAFGVFSDAINYTEAEWQASTVAERRQAARARRDAWLARMTTPTARPTRKELRAEKHSMLQEDIDRAARRAAIEAAIDDAGTPDG